MMVMFLPFSLDLYVHRPVFKPGTACSLGEVLCLFLIIFFLSFRKDVQNLPWELKNPMMAME